MQPLDASPILVDQVYDRVIDAIAACSLQPGQRLRQSDLADMLGVSRQPVSHALQMLKRQGLVEVSGRKGLAVSAIDPGRIRNLYGVRTALDGLAAALAASEIAAERAQPADVAAAREALAAGTALVDDTSRAAWVRADVAFHRAIHRLSGNPAIGETVAAQWPHLMRAMATVIADPAHRARVWSEHAGILRAVLGGEAGEAERLARDHTEKAGRDTAARLEAETSNHNEGTDR